MSKVKEIQLPDGWEVSEIKGGKIILKEAENPIDKLPNTWTDYLKTASPVREINVGISEKYYESIVVLKQLLMLRDCYRMGWKPDWTDDNEKYCIEIEYEKPALVFYIENSSIFAFQSKEIRDKFYNNFKHLLEQLKLLYNDDNKS